MINDFHNIENDAALRKLEENYERIKKEKEELRPSFASKVITSLGITAAACGVVSSVYSNPKLTTITGLGVLVLTFLGQWNM